MPLHLDSFNFILKAPAIEPAKAKPATSKASTSVFTATMHSSPKHQLKPNYHWLTI